MGKYKQIGGILGAGSFGTVFAALDMETGERVAIKQLRDKIESWEQCLHLPELQVLSKLKHPHIVQLKDEIREFDGTASLVFEYMDSDLHKLIYNKFITQNRGGFSEAQIRDFCSQILLALDYMHTNGYVHRDLKPENLLLNNCNGNVMIKIGDFGSATHIDSGPFLDYVTTRWYRAPEVLLGSTVYGPEVDIWAVGAIMGELFNLWPIFGGENSDDQIYRIVNVVGTPTPALDLSLLIPWASPSAIDLIASLCCMDPVRRPTAAQALRHPFFVGHHRIPRAILRGYAHYSTPTSTTASAGIRIKEEQCLSANNFGLMGSFVNYVEFDSGNSKLKHIYL